MLAPIDGRSAFALLPRRPPGKNFRVELTLRILESDGSIALEAGIGSTVPPVSLAYTLSGGVMRFQEKGAGPTEVVRDDPFHLFEATDLPGVGERFRIGIRFGEKELRAYLPDHPGLLSPPHPLRPGMAFEKTHIGIIAYGGPIVIEDLRLLDGDGGG